MFTASITKKGFNEGVMQVVVEFTDGTEIITKAFNINSENDLSRQVKNEIVRLGELSALSKSLPDGEFTPKEEPRTTLTQEEQERNNWFRNFNRLEQLTRLNTLGALRPALVADLDELRARVTTDFRKAYIADM